jgi:2-octaprenyl-6-methoxyphenol hydroxylase
MNNINQQFDVVISGGGLSGSLLALSLSKLNKADGSSLSIAIIEAANHLGESAAKYTHTSGNLNDRAKLFDDRVLALSHGSANYLQQVGVWDLLKQQACSINDIDISDRGHFGKARLNANEQGVDALGYVIDMALIGKAQLQLLSNHTNITWFSPDTITDIKWRDESSLSSTDIKGVDVIGVDVIGVDVSGTDNSHVEVSQINSASQISIALSSGTVLKTSLLLGCDGAQSPCRKLANINVNESEYNQAALITNVATEQPHFNKAFERFTEFGPIAMLPLNSVSYKQTGQGRCSLVWTMPPEQAKKMAMLDENAFKLELELAFGSWLGAITQVGKRNVYPLILLQAKQQTYHRMALVGNASHTIHPIAGQGFNLGLRDVEVMTTLIKDALTQQKDIGSFSLLQQYQLNRSKDQQRVISLTDSLVTLFSNDLPACIIGRNIGLQTLNCFTPLKNMLVKKTMGY